MDIKNLDFQSTVAYVQSGLNEVKKFAEDTVSKYGPRIVRQIDKAAQHLQKNAYQANLTFFVIGFTTFGVSKTISSCVLKTNLKFKASLLMTAGVFVSLCTKTNLPIRNAAAVASYLGGIVFNIVVSSMWCKFSQKER